MKTLLPALTLFVIFCACDKVYFTEPQPVRVMNLHEFPSSFRGTWVAGLDSTIVTRNLFQRIEHVDHVISKTEVDTSQLIVLYNNKIYYKDTTAEIILKGGYSYLLKNDSIYFTSREVIDIELGSTAYLRRSGKNYILNVNRDDIWWELFLIEKNSKGDVLAKCLAPEDLAFIPNASIIYEGNGQHFVDASMDETNLNKFIDRGAFSDTVYELKSEDKKN